MSNKIKECIGNHYVFKLDGVLLSGHFCGIGNIDGDYGMVFIGVKECGMPISKTSCLLVHPLRIKCTLHSDIMSLRRSCRKFFRKHKLENISNNIYHSIYEVDEIYDRIREKTNRR